jgi:hypothetical protein
MLKHHELAQFTGTAHYTKFNPFVPMLLTEGALHVARNGGTNGVFWLMDAIASYQSELKTTYPWANQMQFWKLKVSDKRAVLTCREDLGIPPVVTQEIEYTDFDLAFIELWVAPLDEEHDVIMLPSEY